MRLIAKGLLVFCLVLSSLATARAAPNAETAAFLIALRQVQGSGDAAVAAMGKIGRASGWASPRSSAELGLEGDWQVEDSDGKTGAASLRDGETSGVLKEHEDYTFVRTPRGMPVLIIIGGMWFMPFKKADTLLLVAPINRGTWIALQRHEEASPGRQP